MLESVKDHSGSDSKSHLVKHVIEKNRAYVNAVHI